MSTRNELIDAAAEHFLNIDDSSYEFEFEGKTVLLKWENETFFIFVDEALVGTTENKRRAFKEGLHLVL